MKGIPLRLEMGPRDIENGECVLVRRDTGEKITVKLENLETEIEKLLADIQQNMFNMAKKRMNEKTSVAHNLDEFQEIINKNQGFIKTMWCGNSECEEKVKNLTAAKSRCIPFVQENLGDTCAICGKKATKMVVWGRQY